MSTIALLCTDFDGTLIEFCSQSRCAEEFADILRGHRQEGGLWAINTGRSLLQTLEGLERFQAPAPPDYIITLEREIYRPSPSGEWEDFGDWNKLSRGRHEELLVQCKDVLETIRRKVIHRREVTLIYEQGILIGLRASDEEVLDQIIIELNCVLRSYPEFSYQRNTVYLRFCHADYHKGSALAELCRLAGIPREAVFAVGDNFNDLSMLDGVVAAMCACPANAIDPVKETVLKAEGFVASKNHALGVAESVEYFLRIRV